jgi:MFS family permease
MPVDPDPLDRSYRALLRVPSLGRVLLGMQLARIAQTMVSVALVLFTLIHYDSPALTGLVIFVSLVPGLLISPIAGALLDRHGRTGLIIVDFVVALASLTLIGLLALAGELPAWLLVLIVGVASLTNPLSSTGLRSLFPIIVPAHLWERVNAVDSNGWVVASLIGPPLAAGLVAVVGAPVTLIGVGAVFGVAALVLVGAPDPRTATSPSGSLLRDAWEGVRYTWRNPTLRGLGFSISLLSLSGGMTTIVVPLLVLDHLHLGEAAVGWVFAISGATGIFTASLAGRLDTRGREWSMIVWPMAGTAVAVALLLATDSLLLVALSMALTGILGGPLDIGMFTMRQRRTDPALLGRAYAVSMSFNFSGFPIGSAIAGVIAPVSIDGAILFGVAACLLAAVVAAVLVPRVEPAVEAARTAKPSP